MTRPATAVPTGDTTAGAIIGAPSPTLCWSDGVLRRNGRPHSVRSGSLHYFRVVPEQWHDRLLRLADLGLNSVDTYIPWNFHQQTEGDRPSFTGWRDVGGFIEAAAGVGLDVILRPGPYICAEWSNGGLPSWLTGRRPALRSSDPAFTAPVHSWFDELIPRLAPYQGTRGGPVVAVQLENEYGSYSDDSTYLSWLADLLRSRGVEEMLYTADGPNDVMLDGGAVPGILTAVTLGSKPDAARALLHGRRGDEPFFVAEFWNGWFDHWGQPHHVRDAAGAAEVTADILRDGGSVSIYMAHGGTNFGLWAGANLVDGELRATTTSYDSDAPIAEDGRLTEKFFALREVLGVAQQPIRSAPVHLLAPFATDTSPGAGLMASLRALAAPSTPVSAAVPSFEDLGLDSGLVVYEAEVHLPDRDVELSFDGIADRALVLVDQVPLGTLVGQGTLVASGRGATARLTVIVENLGRVNYGPSLGGLKGLLGPVLVERRRVQRWSARAVALDQVGAELISLLCEPEPGTPPSARRPDDAAGISSATVDLAEPLDTHLRLPGYTKGFVWVNGTLLGRYWNIGPQQTLYVPGPLLRRGTNRIVVLELHRSGTALEFTDTPELGPAEQYIEEF